MDTFELLKGVLYGLVEGLTEWPPVSSVAHLLILDEYVLPSVTYGFLGVFFDFLRLAAALAVVRVFGRALNPVSRHKSEQERRETLLLWARIAAAGVPAVALGLLLGGWVRVTLDTPLVIAIALVVVGAALIVIEGMRGRLALGGGRPRRSGPPDARRRPAGRHLSTPQEPPAALVDAEAPVRSVLDIDFARALCIGAFQVLSLVPGVSCSAATAVGGMLVGCSRRVATRFGIYLVLPTVACVSAVRIVGFFASGGVIAPNELAILVVACTTAFVVSPFVIRFLMGYVRSHDLRPFGWYRIALGVVVILLLVIDR